MKDIFFIIAVERGDNTRGAGRKSYQGRVGKGREVEDVMGKQSLVARTEGDLEDVYGTLLPSMGCSATESMKSIVLENSLLHQLTYFPVYYN